MIRSGRTRRLQAKYPEKEYDLNVSLRKPTTKKTKIIKESRESEEQCSTVIDNMEGAQKRLLKGNLDKDPRPLKTTRTAVLQDRTNLLGERFKVDLLMKQGTQGEVTKNTRAALKAANSQEMDKGDVQVKKLVSGTRTKSQRGRKDSSHIAVEKETVKPRTLRSKDTAIINDESKLKTGKNSEKTNESSDKKDIKNMKKESSARTMKTTLKKVVVEKESSDEQEVEDHETEQPKIQKRKVRVSRKKNSESAESTKDDDNLTKPTTSSRVRKTSGITNVEKEPSTGTKENSEVQKSSKRSSKSVANRNSLKVNGKRLSRGENKNVSSKGSKKFFHNPILQAKFQALPVKKTVKTRRKNNTNVSLNVSYKLRQPTLQESFAKQKSQKVLRPRKAKDNEEKTNLATTDTKGDENVDKKKVGPIYKSVEVQENSIKGKDEVYEFQFDADDSQEKMPKRKKRAVKRNPGTKTKSKVKKGTSSNIMTKKSEIEVAKKLEKIDEADDVRESNQQIEEIQVPPIEIMDFDELPTVSDIPKSSPIKIVKSVNLAPNERINLTTTPVLAKSSESKTRNVARPLKQYRKMLSHDLLNKSMSPINRMIENFDPGSPWRPPIFVTQKFSCVKNIVHSTPQVKKFSTLLEKNPSKSDVSSETELKSDKLLQKIEENKENPETSPNQITEETAGEILEKSPMKVSEKSLVEISEKPTPKISEMSPIKTSKKSPIKAMETSKSPRKFGTEILNISPSGLYPKVIDLNKENVRTNSPIATESKMMTMSEPGNSLPLFDDDFSDKENSLTSPKKSPLKAFNKSPMKTKLSAKTKSPLKNVRKVFANMESQRISNKENAGPRAGPSNENKPRPVDSRILRQSNLNSFLNVDEMPKSTTITTQHGIFGDISSAPISAKSSKKNSKELDAKNAFGFDESSTESFKENVNIPPVVAPKAVKIKDIIKEAAPARFSLGQVKEVFSRKNENIGKEKIIQQEEHEENQPNEETVETIDESCDPNSFIDTFDLFGNSGCKESEIKEIPIFAELEPIHFKEAPRFSYKRKRRVGFFLSEDEDADESMEQEQRIKKRKKSKVEMEREKRLENWVKDLNRTFEEIDHFDLVVE